MKPVRGIVFQPRFDRLLLGLTYRRCTGNLALFPGGPFFLKELDLEELPGPSWVRVRCRLAGICGTDLKALRLSFSTRSATLAGKRSITRMVCMGHEAVGEVLEVGANVRTLTPGQRVVLVPGGSCLTLGMEQPCEMCGKGLPLLCLKRDEFVPGPAVGAGWSEQFFRHELQLFPLSDDISDEQAILIEPLACAVHTVLRRAPAPNDTVVVIGCGMIGLGIILALKALGTPIRIIAIAKHSYQANNARTAGADLVLTSREGDLYKQLAWALGTEVRARGKRNRLLHRGAAVVYDAVGSGETLQDALRWTKPRGAVVVEGVTARPSPADCTAIWFNEVDLIGSHGHGEEHYDGRRIHTFSLVAQWIRQRRIVLDGLITHRQRLPDFKQAIRAADRKWKSHATKVLLEMRAS